MDIPFPVTTPRFIDSMWFNADDPCDEEAELNALEQSNQSWLSSSGQHYRARPPPGKADPEPMEECESEEEDGNDESDESEETHDDDEVEEVQPSLPSPQNPDEQVPTVDLSADSMEPDTSEPEQTPLWP